MLTDKPFTFDRVIRIAITVGIGWGMLTLLAYLSDVLMPFAVALLLAYLINPLVSWVQRRIRLKTRVLAVLLSLLVILIIVAVFLIVLIPLIIAEITHMKNLLSGVIDTDQIQEQVFFYVPNEVWSYITGFIESEELIQLLNYQNVKELSQQILPGVWGVFSGTITFFVGLLGIVIILLYLVFILVDFEEVSEGWKNLIPPQYKTMIIAVLDDFKSAMQSYFRAQALIAFIVGILFAIGFWLIGLPMGIFLGLFIGLLNMVPYLQVIGLIPAGLFALMSSLETGENAWFILLMTLLIFVVIQLIQDAVLVPKIMGNVTGFNPAVILLSLSVWGKLLGMLGLIIALPITFLIHSYYKRYIIPMAK